MCTQTSSIPHKLRSTESANPQSPPSFTEVLEQGLRREHSKLAPPQLTAKKRNTTFAKRKLESLLLSSPETVATPLPNDNCAEENCSATKRRKLLSKQIKLLAQRGGHNKAETIFPILKRATMNENNNNEYVSNTNNNYNQNKKYSLFSMIKGEKPRVTFAKSTKITMQTKSLNGPPRTPSKYDSIWHMTLQELTSNLQRGAYTVEHQKDLLKRAKKNLEEHEKQKQRLLATSSTTKVTAQKLVQNRLDKFKLMCKALKIYIEARRVLERTDRFLSSMPNTMGELRSKRKDYARHLHDCVLKSIVLFQRNISSNNMNISNNDQLKKGGEEKALIDVNITFSGKYGKLSLLHAAVLLYDENIIHYLLKSGIDHSRKIPSTELAKDLFRKARARNDPKMASSYHHIVKILEQK